MSRQDHRDYDAALQRLREEQRALDIQKEEITSGDIALWCLAAFVAIVLFLAAYKIGRLITLVGLIGMLACLVHPLWRLPIVKNKQSLVWKIVSFVIAILLAGGGIAAFGFYVWPPLKRHPLNAREIARFERPLKAQKSKRNVLKIYCPQADESACTYAVQFLNIFGESGWDAGYLVERLSLTRPSAGVVFLLPTTAKKSDLEKWNAGGWSSISPSLKHIRQAFLGIEVEPDSTADPDIPEGTMGIYFGNEKENANENTHLTDTIKRAEEIRRSGQFPVPNED